MGSGVVTAQATPSRAGNMTAKEQVADQLRIVQEYALRAESFTRLDVLLEQRRRLPRAVWLKLLGQLWTVCDNVGKRRLTLRKVLGVKGPLLPMMDSDERAAYRRLPDVVTIYRGCGARNLLGASWSLDRDVAARFPFLGRYLAAQPLLLTATVAKESVLAVKLGRDEAEIVTFVARRRRVDSLLAGSADKGS